MLRFCYAVSVVTLTATLHTDRQKEIYLYNNTIKKITIATSARDITPFVREPRFCFFNILYIFKTLPLTDTKQRDRGPTRSTRKTVEAPRV